MVFVDYASEYSVTSDWPGDGDGGGLVVVVGGALVSGPGESELRSGRARTVGGGARVEVEEVASQQPVGLGM